MIKSPILQFVTGKQGFYQQFNVQKKPMSVKEYYHKACSERYATPKYFDYEDLERKFWKNVTYIQPIYGTENICPIKKREHDRLFVNIAYYQVLM